MSSQRDTIEKARATVCRGQGSAARPPVDEKFAVVRGLQPGQPLLVLFANPIISSPETAWSAFADLWPLTPENCCGEGLDLSASYGTI